MTLVYRLVPRQKMGTAMGIFGLGIIFAPAVGPVLGGYFVQYVDWRLVFYVNVPVGIAGAIAAYLLLPKVPGKAGRRFDLPGFLCIGSGLFAILLAASEGSDWGWDGYRIRMLLVFGALALALFVVIELEVDQPLLDIRVFRYWQFTSSLIMLAALQINLLGISFFVPVFLQQGQHKEAFDAGILLLPQALATGVLSPIVGRLYDRIGPRWLGAVGLAVCGYGTYLLASITATMTRGDLLLWTCIRGAGLGMAIMPIMTAGLSALPGRSTNEGSALNNVARQTTGALGLALLSALSTSQQAQLMADRGALIPTLGQHRPQTPSQFGALYGRYLSLSNQVLATSYANIFLLVGAITAAGVLLALFLRKPSAPAGPGAGAAAGH
jgi:EmrB/QacA subfamily drug resistance transporter